MLGTMRAGLPSLLCLLLPTVAVLLPQVALGQNAAAVPAAPAPVPHHPRFGEPDAFDFNDHAGFVPIFDGKTLQGWEGDPTVWHVEEGAIVGRASAEHPVPNTYLSYHGTPAHDFDLKLEVKVEQGAAPAFSTAAPWARRGCPNRAREPRCPRSPG